MPSVTVKFKSNKAAEQFAANFSMLGERATVEIRESNAIVSSDDHKAVRFVKHMASDLAEEMRCTAYANRMLSAILECMATGESRKVSLMDNTEQQMTVRQAEVLGSTHDRLNEENQAAFLVLASESKDAYAHAVNFARTNEEIV